MAPEQTNWSFTRPVRGEALSDLCNRLEERFGIKSYSPIFEVRHPAEDLTPDRIEMYALANRLLRTTRIDLTTNQETFQRYPGLSASKGIDLENYIVHQNTELLEAHPVRFVTIYPLQTRPANRRDRYVRLLLDRKDELDLLEDREDMTTCIDEIAKARGYQTARRPWIDSPILDLIIAYQDLPGMSGSQPVYNRLVLAAEQMIMRSMPIEAEIMPVKQVEFEDMPQEKDSA